jgi:mRNA interferase YafQ
MIDIVPSNRFKKDLKLAKKRGFKLKYLQRVINVLAQQKKLDDHYKDHSLTGDYRGFRECHIEPDWLLVYRIDNDALELFLFRTGTHSDLFR